MCFAVQSDFLLSKKMDLRIGVKFYVKNRITCSKKLEILAMAYDESDLSKQNIYK